MRNGAWESAAKPPREGADTTPQGYQHGAAGGRTPSMFLHNARVHVPPPGNEPILPYAPGSPEKRDLKAALDRLGGEKVEIRVVIGGKRIRTGKTGVVRSPHRSSHVLATYQAAGTAEVEQAIAAARDAWMDWSRWPWEARAAVFLRAAELLATKHRMTVNAATMLGQSKTAHQAEIDSACETIDFLRWNVHFA